MALLFLYSTNPAITHDIANKYRNGKHFVWCSEFYNPVGAPSSSPKELYRILEADCKNEDTHSSLIDRYKKTFRRLANNWYSKSEISESQKDEILAIVNSKSWKIWRPQLYIIYRPPIEISSRLIAVPASKRAAVGEEWQITSLDSAEFEIFERE